MGTKTLQRYDHTKHICIGAQGMDNIPIIITIKHRGRLRPKLTHIEMNWRILYNRWNTFWADRYQPCFLFYLIVKCFGVRPTSHEQNTSTIFLHREEIWLSTRVGSKWVMYTLHFLTHLQKAHRWQNHIFMEKKQLYVRLQKLLVHWQNVSFNSAK